MEASDPGTPEPTGPTGRWARLRAFRQRHQTLEHALFFLGGFAFDVVILDRIDHVATLVQHGVYLVLLLGLVLVDQRHALVGDLPAGVVKRLAWVENVTHFFLGTLLNTFCVFYFKSGTGLTALLFLAILFGLLALNEVPRFRARGPIVRVALYGFCLTSYLAYLYPVLAGRLGRLMFISAAGTSSLVLLGVALLLVRWRREQRGRVRRMVGPAAALQGLLVALYLLKLIPPVPLAVSFMGIYHGLQKVGRDYELQHQRPDWRIWEHGDQQFLARSGDRIFVFVRVFAPHRFRDRIKIRWMYDDPRRGWRTTDVIPLTVTGEREEGFRGHAFKRSYEPGDWRVDVETDDGRDLKTLRFTVLPDASSEPREWKLDRG